MGTFIYQCGVCTTCGGSMARSPSLYYCSSDCQYRWTSAHADLPPYEPTVYPYMGGYAAMARESQRRREEGTAA